MIECCSRVNQGTFVIKRFCLEISLGFFLHLLTVGSRYTFKSLYVMYVCSPNFSIFHSKRTQGACAYHWFDCRFKKNASKLGIIWLHLNFAVMICKVNCFKMKLWCVVTFTLQKTIPSCNQLKSLASNSCWLKSLKFADIAWIIKVIYIAIVVNV